jgi:predicted metal-dependent hydrolase
MKPVEKTIELCGQSVSYRLARCCRRSIGLTIDRRGLTVGAPSRASATQIDAALRKHDEWILEKLAQWRQRQARERAQLADGGELPWLGTPCRLARTDGRSQHLPATNRLEIAAPAGVALLPTLILFFKREARPLFAARIEHYAARLGVSPPPLFLSSAQSRWGSCNTKGEVRLSWRLLHFAPPLIDYVVAHELAHLKEMNHSARFWAIVSRLYPEWRQARTEIRRLAPMLPQLCKSS